MTIKVVFASPGQGKSYFATHKALKALKKGRKVFSNYPIITPDGKSTYIWKPEYALENVQNALIIVDEAYRDYNSREHKDFSREVHTFFATNRHNGLDIILIAQNPARIDLVLREITSEFVFMKKHCIPLTDIPVIFTASGYLDELSLANRHVGESDTLEFILFSKKTGQSYDTHFYSNDEKPFEGVTWLSLVESGTDIFKKDNWFLWTLKPLEKIRKKAKVTVLWLRSRVVCFVSSVKIPWKMIK